MPTSYVTTIMSNIFYTSSPDSNVIIADKASNFMQTGDRYEKQ